MINTYRKTKKGARKTRLAASGNKFYVNGPENEAAESLYELGKKFSKRGYPDLTVYNEDGSIYGFMEIKSDEDRQLKQEQQVFSEFCLKHNIPFIRWSPSAGKTRIEEFLQMSSS